MSASQLESSIVTFESATTFVSDSVVSADSVRFDAGVEVASGVFAQIDGSVSDPLAQASFDKRGLGVLVLSQANSLSVDVSVREGTLQVDGTLEAPVLVLADGTLSGSGRLDAVAVRGGNVAPSESFPGQGAGELFVSDIVLDPDASFTVDVAGGIEGDSLDSLRFDRSIGFEGAELRLNITEPIPEDTELLVIQNDTTEFLSDRFTVLFDEAGNPIDAPRVLNEGDLVLQRFGPGDAVPAFITYFGGDGNDVAIVTAGDRLQPRGNVTLVTRRAFDLHIRQGDSLAEAQAAIPTIRPIAGLNRKRINGTGRFSASSIVC